MAKHFLSCILGCQDQRPTMGIRGSQRNHNSANVAKNRCGVVVPAIGCDVYADIGCDVYAVWSFLLLVGREAFLRIFGGPDQHPIVVTRGFQKEQKSTKVAKNGCVAWSFLL